MTSGKPKSLSEIWQGMQSSLQSQVQRNLLSPGAGYGMDYNYDFEPFSSSWVGSQKPEQTEERKAEREKQHADNMELFGNRVGAGGEEGDKQSNVDAGEPGFKAPEPGSFVDALTKFTAPFMEHMLPESKIIDPALPQEEQDLQKYMLSYYYENPEFEAEDGAKMIGRFFGPVKPAIDALSAAFKGVKKVRSFFTKDDPRLTTYDDTQSAYDAAPQSTFDAPSFQEAISSMLGYDPSLGPLGGFSLGGTPGGMTGYDSGMNGTGGVGPDATGPGGTGFGSNATGGFDPDPGGLGMGDAGNVY